MYLTDSWEVEFTHAENGYLQVALETGLPGLVLLLGGIALCGRLVLPQPGRPARSQDLPVRRGGGGRAGGQRGPFAGRFRLVHPVADGHHHPAGGLRLPAGAWPVGRRRRPAPRVSPGRLWQWRLAPLAVALVGGWMVYDRFCAAMAEPHWDHFLNYALKSRNRRRENVGRRLDR